MSMPLAKGLVSSFWGCVSDPDACIELEDEIGECIRGVNSRRHRQRSLRWLGSTVSYILAELVIHENPSQAAVYIKRWSISNPSWISFHPKSQRRWNRRTCPTAR